MSTEANTPESGRPSLLKNWISLTGLVIVVGSLFSALLLFILDTIARSSNPYIGILTYFVAPFFLFLGLFLTVAGAWRERKRLGSKAGILPRMTVDLSRPRDRRIMAGFIGGSVIFLLISAVGSYHTYHFTESVTFCGEACHTVMKPELVTYQQGPHARVACVECHIGRGATWFVKSKLSGTYQVYATAFNKYPRPVPTPIKNLRPAQETCEQCHWPKKFVGNLDRTYSYFLADETNTPYTVRMVMKVGGGDLSRGPATGIHWHMSVANKIEYIATDEARQKIPWVRVTNRDNPEAAPTEYRVKGFTNAVNEADIRVMDCMDCHNRPAHMYQTPNRAVNHALSLDHIDRSLPFVKSNAVYALTLTYTNESEAVGRIAELMSLAYPADRYPGLQAGLRRSTEAVQHIYRNNFFPEMKANWQAYPDNIGHKDWLGCFRCHDGKHKTADGAKSIDGADCNSCHTILAQGSGAELDQLTPAGQKFKHPGDEVDGACNDCHTGGL
jgi:nitrate/TMAO reductase-like tetraheme cytochrome c subunit